MPHEIPFPARSLARRGICATVLLLAGCSSASMFQSNFDRTPVGNPPAAGQRAGTLNIYGSPDSVLVADDQTGETDHWLQIGRSGIQSGQAGAQGILARSAGDGKYTFYAHLFMPSDGGIATIDFEPNQPGAAPPPSFLRLDLTRDNDIEIDGDQSTKFGWYPRNQIFVLKVTLTINGTAPIAHVSLSGFGARGARDYYIVPGSWVLAQQFGAVRLALAGSAPGAFFASDIKVKAGRG